MTTPYSAGVQFPRPDEDRPDPRPVDPAEGLWEPGSMNARAHGCLCTNAHDFPNLGHQLATACPVHEVRWGVRLPEQRCHCGGIDCTASCPVYEREGLG